MGLTDFVCKQFVDVIAWKLHGLVTQGVIPQEELEAKKAQLLSKIR